MGNIELKIIIIIITLCRQIKSLDGELLKDQDPFKATLNIIVCLYYSIVPGGTLSEPLIMSPTSLRTAMLAMYQQSREPVVHPVLAALVICLCNQNGQEETRKLGKKLQVCFHLVFHELSWIPVPISSSNFLKFQCSLLYPFTFFERKVQRLLTFKTNCSLKLHTIEQFKIDVLDYNSHVWILMTTFHKSTSWQCKPHYDVPKIGLF